MQKGRGYPQFPQHCISADMLPTQWAPRRCRLIGTFIYDLESFDLAAFGDSAEGVWNPTNPSFQWLFSHVFDGALLSASVLQVRDFATPSTFFAINLVDTSGSDWEQQRIWQIGQGSWGNPFFQAGVYAQDVVTGPRFTHLFFAGVQPIRWH